MKIAVISDIHGNMDALEAVMKDIEKKECEKIFALGDYAMAGPEPALTVDWFMEKAKNKNFTLIQGNTDLMIADYSDFLYDMVKNSAPVMAEALRNDTLVLNPLHKEFLKNLPIQVEVEEESVKFLLCHGSPRKNNEDILPDTPMAKVEEMLVNVDAQVVLCGHTHIPCGFQTSTKQTVVNAGSVGRPFTAEPKACYLLVDVWKSRCVFEHQFVSYNNKKAAQTLSKRKFSGAERLAETLLNPKERHF